jgi:hypothetical protein
MALIQRDGHVIMPVARSTLAEGPRFGLRSVGRNGATTFTGLCQLHDGRIFAPIEMHRLDLNDPEHLFLLAYRAATKELHAQMETAFRAQAAYQERLDRGLDKEHPLSLAGQYATIRVMAAHATWSYRTYLDEALLSSDRTTLGHDVFILEDQTPTVAVSSLFSLDDLLGGEPCMVHLSVMPLSATETGVVLSYANNATTRARDYLKRVLTTSAPARMLELSRVILNHCENFVLSPTYFDSWSQAKKDAVIAYFAETISGRPADDGSALLLLF